MKKITIIPSPSAEVPGQFIYHLPERIGSGVAYIDTFASGLGLVYTNVQLKEKIRTVTETTNWGFGIGFSLKGYSRVHNSALQGDFPIEAGKSGHSSFPGSTVLTEDIGPGRRVKINIVFDAGVLSDFARDDEEAFLPFLQRFKDQIPFVNHDRILPHMHQALNQVLTCPYTGKTRALFLESKALELMAYKLEQIKTKTRPSLRQYGVSPYDIERIRHAAGRLRHDPVNPPDITTLAVAAGMSRSKFYRCFKQVYGHSPLDHLRNHRLQLAKIFLSTGKHNVTEAAYAVGYSNLSYFARIFTAQFGISPHKVF
nr:AraC family transcriptional regulator [uncultured Desulfobacter sp.]